MIPFLVAPRVSALAVKLCSEVKLCREVKLCGEVKLC
ncbi:hypothetical protein Tco_0441404, partial [Tanacetum coccineum]